MAQWIKCPAIEGEFLAEKSWAWQHHQERAASRIPLEPQSPCPQTRGPRMTHDIMVPGVVKGPM